MNKRRNVFVLGILCLILLCSSDSIMSQSSMVFQFAAEPYPSSMMESLEKDNVPTSSLVAVLNAARTGAPQVDLAFLADRFYLFFDLNGMKRVYLLDYHDSVEAYASELSLNGIPNTQLSATELVNCILKYHTRE